MKNKLLIKIILTLTVMISTALLGNAQTCPGSPGCLDYTFGSGGTTFTIAPRIPASNNTFLFDRAVVQNDGKLLGLYDAHDNSDPSYTNAIVRYNLNGSLDTAFGNNGFLYMNWNTPTNAYGSAFAITTQLIGMEEKILVAGSFGSSMVLRVDRYNLDGSADTSFGTDGRVVYNTGYATQIAVQPDGKILTTGDAKYMARLEISGALDTTFGNGGIIQISVFKPSALALQANGRIVIAGNLSGSGPIAVARLNANGTPDDGTTADSTPTDSFGTAGKTTVEFYSGGTTVISGSGTRLKVDGTGRILIGGDAMRRNSTKREFGIARLTANGQLDKTFDGDGKATVSLSSIGDSVRTVSLQSDGKIVLVGVTSFNIYGRGQDLGIARFNSNGTLDTTFGNRGTVVSNLFNGNERNYNGLIQFDPNCGCEKIAVIGSADDASVYYSVAARFIQ